MQPESIFRPEALEHHQRGRGPGDLIPLSPVWTTWAFWLLLVFFSGLVAALLLITLEEDLVAGAVVDRNGSVVALFPATYSEDLEVGDPLTLDNNEWRGAGEPIQLEIERVGDPIAPGSTGSLPDFAAPLAAGQSQTSIPVWASLPEGTIVAGGTATGIAVVHIEDRLLLAIVPGLRGLFSSDE